MLELGKKKLDKKKPKKIHGIFNVHGESFVYDRRSLFLFTPDNPLRKAIVWLVTSKWFKNFILLTILFNSVTIGLETKEMRVNLKSYMEP